MVRVVHLVQAEVPHCASRHLNAIGRIQCHGERDRGLREIEGHQGLEVDRFAPGSRERRRCGPQWRGVVSRQLDFLPILLTHSEMRTVSSQWHDNKRKLITTLRFLPVPRKFRLPSAGCME